MPNLFTPLKIKGLELKNRIMVSPMCQYSAADGFANDWHLVHLGSRAVGGAGLIMVEATAVSPEGRISPGDLGLWQDEHIESFKRITKFISEQGSVPGIQIAHAGRKASHSEPWNGDILLSPDQCGWKTVAPSPIKFTDGYDTPVALSIDGINKIISAFTQASDRAVKSGFKIIEIHAAHGYLINEFLSPLSNQRNDIYGGSFENRIRLLVEIVENIKTVIPADLPLFVRLSATEWIDGGWTIEDSVKLVNILKNKGVDLIDCSSGGNVLGVKIPLVPGYQVSLSEKIKKETGILTGAVGLISDSSHAEEIINTDKADLAIIARELLRNPYFPLNAAFELGQDVEWPKQYLRAKPKR